LVCGVVFLVCSFGGVGLLGWAASERQKFDPIYTPIVCTPVERFIQPITMVVPDTLADGSKPDMSIPSDVAYVQGMTRFTTSGRISKRCVNDNNMDIEIETRQDGDATVRIPGFEPMAAGRTSVRKVKIPMNSAATVTTVSDFELEPAQAGAIIGLGGNATVVTKMYWRRSNSLKMLGMQRESVREYEQYCGFRVTLDLAGSSIVGPSKCADTESELLPIIPDRDDEDRPGTIEISKDTKEAAERGRDLACGLVMAVGILMVVCCCSCGVVTIKLSVAQRKSAASKEEASDLPQWTVKNSHSSE